MTARFMSDTPYAGTEQEMQRIPGFHSRGTGIAVSHLGTAQRTVTVAYVPIKAEKESAKKRMDVSACVNGLWQAVCHLKNCWKG
jgi:hypothetical protein